MLITWKGKKAKVPNSKILWLAKTGKWKCMILQANRLKWN